MFETSLFHPSFGIVDWPLTWDQPVQWHDDPKWVRFMQKLWHDRMPVIRAVLRNRCHAYGPDAVRILLPRLLKSTTVIHDTSSFAASLPEDLLAKSYNSEPPNSEEMTYVETEPGVYLEGYIHVADDSGDWLHAELELCVVAAARVLIRGLVEEYASGLK